MATEKNSDRARQAAIAFLGTPDGWPFGAILLSLLNQNLVLERLSIRITVDLSGGKCFSSM